MSTTDWVRDGHTLSLVLEEYVVSLVVNCPLFPGAPGRCFGTGDECQVAQFVTETGIEDCLDIPQAIRPTVLPIPIAWRWDGWDDGMHIRIRPMETR